MRRHVVHADGDLVAADDIATAIATIGRAVHGGAARRPRSLGVHLEGPFLNPARRARTRAAPAPTVARRGCGAGRGDAGVAMVTLAPELPGALEVDRAPGRRAGVTVCAGHTDADAHGSTPRSVAGCAA